MTLVNEGFEPGCPPEILRAEKFRRTTCRRCRRGRDSGAGFRRRPSRSRNRPVRDREDMELTLNESSKKTLEQFVQQRLQRKFADQVLVKFSNLNTNNSY